eukprot:7700340-Pyramimonas_sp.AAC.1
MVMKYVMLLGLLRGSWMPGAKISASHNAIIRASSLPTLPVSPPARCCLTLCAPYDIVRR